MALTQDTTKAEKASKSAAEKAVIAAEPVVLAEAKATKPVNKAKASQTIITIAIISGVVLFFLGLGLGYMLGRAGTSSRTNPGNGTMQPPSDGGGRRSMPYPDTDNTTDDSKSDTKTQTN